MEQIERSGFNHVDRIASFTTCIYIKFIPNLKFGHCIVSILCHKVYVCLGLHCTCTCTIYIFDKTRGAISQGSTVFEHQKSGFYFKNGF